MLGVARDRYAGRHTVVVGSGHSAATTLLGLAELAQQVPGTRVTWAVRAANPDRAYGGGDDALPARGALGSGLRMLVAESHPRATTAAEQAADSEAQTVSVDRRRLR